MDVRSKMISVIESFNKMNKEPILEGEKDKVHLNINNNKTLTNNIEERKEIDNNMNVDFIKKDISNVWMGGKVVEEIDSIKKANNQILGLIESSSVEFGEVIEGIGKYLVEMKEHESREGSMIGGKDKIFFEDSLNKTRIRVDIPKINNMIEVEEIIEKGQMNIVGGNRDIVKTIFEDINTKDVQSNFNWQSLNNEIKKPHLSKNNTEMIKETTNKVDMSVKIKENLFDSNNSVSENYNQEILTKKRSVVLKFNEVDTRNNLKNTLIENNQIIDTSVKKINDFVSKIVEDSENKIRSIENKKDFDINEFIGKEKNLKMIYNNIDNNILNKLLRN